MYEIIANVLGREIWQGKMCLWKLIFSVPVKSKACLRKLMLPMVAKSNIGTAFRGMHVSPAKHSYVWLPRKCDYRTDTQTDRHTDGQTDARRHKNVLVKIDAPVGIYDVHFGQKFRISKPNSLCLILELRPSTEWSASYSQNVAFGPKNDANKNLLSLKNEKMKCSRTAPDFAPAWW